MKLIKAKIEVEHPNASSTRFVGYPREWLDNKEKIVSVLDPGDRKEEIEENGKIYKILYAVCQDDIFDLLTSLEGIESADKQVARAYAEQKYPPRMITTDQEAVNAVLVKVAKGETLTKKEKEAIDPDFPEPGVSRTKNWIDNVETNHGTIT